MYIFSSSNKESWEEYIKLFANSNYFIDKQKNLSLIALGSLNKSNFKNLNSLFQKEFSNKKIKVSNDLLHINKSDIIFLLISKGSISEKELEDNMKKINISPGKCFGWFLIEENSIRSFKIL